MMNEGVIIYDFGYKTAQCCSFEGKAMDRAGNRSEILNQVIFEKISIALRFRAVYAAPQKFAGYTHGKGAAIRHELQYHTVGTFCETEVLTFGGGGDELRRVALDEVKSARHNLKSCAASSWRTKV